MSDSTVPSGPLRVKADSSPQRVAAAIGKSISDSNHYPTLRAIGHGAVGQTVKAIGIARGHVAPKGIDLATIIGFETIEGTEGNDITAMTFKTFSR
jgi:stage V sporulation protein S